MKCKNCGVNKGRFYAWAVPVVVRGFPRIGFDHYCTKCHRERNRVQSLVKLAVDNIY